jgi:hypothetical protein
MARSSHDANPQAPLGRRHNAALDQPSHSSAARPRPAVQGRRQHEHRIDVTRLPGKLATGGITVIGRRLLTRPTAMLALSNRTEHAMQIRFSRQRVPLHRPALTSHR